MTEHTDIVEEARLRQEAEKWGKQIKSIQGSDGIIETRFNNGDIHYRENKEGGKSWTVSENSFSKQTVWEYLRNKIKK